MMAHPVFTNLMGLPQWTTAQLIAWVMFRDPEIVRIALTESRATVNDVVTRLAVSEVLHGRIDERLMAAAVVYRAVEDLTGAERTIRVALADGNITAIGEPKLSQWSKSGYVYLEDRVLIAMASNESGSEHLEFMFDSRQVIKTLPQGKPAFTLSEIAKLMNERFGIDYRGMLQQLMQAARAGEFKLTNPETKIRCTPDVVQEQWHCLDVADFNAWAGSNGYEIRLPMPREASMPVFGEQSDSVSAEVARDRGDAESEVLNSQTDVSRGDIVDVSDAARTSSERPTNVIAGKSHALSESVIDKETSKQRYARWQCEADKICAANRSRSRITKGWLASEVSKLDRNARWDSATIERRIKLPEILRKPKRA